jgi:hypothetical protein
MTLHSPGDIQEEIVFFKALGKGRLTTTETRAWEA